MLVRKRRAHTFFRWFFMKPARAIITSFLLVDVIGTILLMLPMASQNGQSLGLINAAFTTVSATCVTGLVVVDTATHFTTFGKVVILCLIQIGGLGLVSITTFFLIILRRKVGLRTKVLLQEAAGSFSFLELKSLLKSIIFVTLGIEFLGFVLLSTQYVPLFGWEGGLSKAGFQAVSAFCNAGFDLMGDTAAGPFSSLTAYNGNPVILLTTAFLIIFGGLGFVVWRDILGLRKTKSLHLHSRIVITITIILILIGTLFFMIVEWNNMEALSLGTLPVWQRPIASFFQSVTLRTAGFNSISLFDLNSESKLFSSILMFIGAAPGSTGGGIKITTFSILLFSVLADIRGRDEIVMKKHLIHRQAVRRAIATFFLSLCVVLLLSMGLCFSESVALHSGRFEYLDLLFESASAFGTVGLSSVGTPDLTTLSHLFIMPVMFIGRVGPVTFAMSLALREAKAKKISNIYPEGRIQIG